MRTFAQLVEELRAGNGPVRLVGVDGFGAAGKTTFAAQLSAAAGGCPVVHTDDFASHEDALGWAQRLLHEVIEPLSAGETARYRPYDWVARRPSSEDVVVPGADIVVIEGVGATRAAIRDRLTLRIWIDSPPAVRRDRALARDGHELRGFWEWWVQQEDGYVLSEQPQRHADLVVDGAPTGSVPPGCFVVVSEPREAAAAPPPRR